MTGVGASPVYDTLYNGSNRIATIELYPEVVGDNFHLEVFFSAIDSTAYNYAFKTTGSGNYDLWSGTTMGLNAIVSTIPSAAVYPPIIHYAAPDTLVTVVSSWNCSEKVISVGNIRNRFGHTDKNGTYYQPAPSYTAETGELSPNSSKGPTRHGLTKPDVSACGDVSLSAGPMWVFSYPAANSVIDEDNWHVRNGGTSMASPVVAGIAALYLEKCHNGTYATFKSALTGTAFTDAFTGAVPNNAYGYGKAHALNTLLASNYSATVDGPAQFCGSDTAFAVTTAVIDSISWGSGSVLPYDVMSGSGLYYFTSFDNNGCVAYSDTLDVIAGDIPATPIITVSGNILSTATYPNLQWYENGVAIPGETGDSLTITLPSSSNFTVVAIGTTGCEASSVVYNPSASLFENEKTLVIVYPNPVTEELIILSKESFQEVLFYNVHGNLVKSLKSSGLPIDVRSFASGTYLVCLKMENAVHWTKIIKK
jgi:hypothetical protein